MIDKASQHAKQAVGMTAANLVEEGMVVGIGTGSTAAYFIDALAQRCRDGLSITGVATSKASAHRAQQGGIRIVDLDSIAAIDVAIDGADEIDSKKRMIKGGGGALLREKIIASIAREMVVIIDETKMVDHLGTFGLPIEIVPFGYTHTLRHLNELGYRGHLRKRKDAEPYLTDNGNYLCDLEFDGIISNPEELDRTLHQIVGVVETGLFLEMAGRVVIGYSGGRVEVEL